MTFTNIRIFSDDSEPFQPEARRFEVRKSCSSAKNPTYGASISFKKKFATKMEDFASYEYAYLKKNY